MKKQLFLLAGLASLALGGIGVILPLLPTVPFMILAAFCFANSSPRLERWLVEHKTFGPHIQNWRKGRAITRKGKWAATIAFAASCVISLVFAKLPWSLAPFAAALIGGTWIWTRAEPRDLDPPETNQ
ncbi:MAG: YbaN family protein [Parasphingorhabdus sp.]